MDPIVKTRNGFDDGVHFKLIIRLLPKTFFKLSKREYDVMVNRWHHGLNRVVEVQKGFAA